VCDGGGKERYVPDMSEDEIARLANRLAMLVSDDGEADNAGRAVGVLARRLGISGGQIKAIFMAGMQSAGASSARLAEQDARLEALTQELQQTREALQRAEAAGRTALRERDALLKENDGLHGALDRRRSGRQVRIAVGLVVLAGLAGGGWLALNRPQLRLLAEPAPQADSPLYRSGVVHEANVAMYTQPDANSPAVTTLTEGTHVVVRRTLWHNLEQWVEIEFNGKSGYVRSADIDLS
jgi:hypothetical protein